LGYNVMVMKWKNIPSVPLYECTSCGKIRRKVTIVAFGKNQRKAGGKMLSPKTKTNGYQEVNLNNKSKYVHRLVAEAWIGKIPPKMTVNHKDGDKTNNAISNLEIVTYAENSKHGYENGLIKPPVMKGENHPRVKTNAAEVIKIRKEHQNHKSIKQLLQDYPNLSKGSLTKIVYRQCWKHIF
jgi:hypothetical protein